MVRIVDDNSVLNSGPLTFPNASTIVMVCEKLANK